jgi:glycosyltransferase involved in cell wall biosynthesis
MRFMSSLAIISTHPIQYYAPLFRLLAKRLDRVKVFYEKIPDATAQGHGYNQWDVDLLSGYGYSSGNDGLRELLHGLERKEYDAVLLNGWQTPFMWRSYFHALETSAPLMVRGDSHLRTPRSVLKQWVKEPLYRAFLSKFDACLAVGALSAEYFRYYGVSEHRIIASPHCIDNGWFSERAELMRSKRNELRKEMGFSEEEIIFLFVGRLSQMKRVEDFLRAFTLCRKENPRIRGLIIGDGECRDELERLGRKICPQVAFKGFLNQKEIVSAYAVSDCLVLPSDARETWGLVVNEAMACGLPCIVSDQVGCGTDMIVPGVNGGIFPCGDVQALSNQISLWAQQSKVSSAAFKSVLEKHSCERAVSGILHAMQVGK